MYPSSHYKTKIVAGKLVTVPIYSTTERNNYSKYNRSFDPCLSRQENGRYNHVSISSSARLEAQKNKERAVFQTYRSVLSPEPRYNERCDDDLSSADPLIVQVAYSLKNASRHKLLSALSSMKRLDPENIGMLSYVELQEILAIYNISMDSNTFGQLLNRYQVSSYNVDYQRLWKYVMDCYALKDQIHGNARKSVNVSMLPEQKSEEFYANQEWYSNQLSKRLGIAPGLQSELEYVLRQYARTNQACFDTRNIEHICKIKDQFGTGKILSKLLLDICYKEMLGLDMNIIHNLLRACESDHNGLVEYKTFFRIISEAQPTYLPPIDASPRFQPSVDCTWKPQEPYQNHLEEEKDHVMSYLNKLTKNKGEAVSCGHQKELEDIGGLALHLSDFETKVATRKSSVDTPITPTSPCLNNRTYSVSTPDFALKSIVNAPDGNQSTPPHVLITPNKTIVTSPKKTSNRKQWNSSRQTRSEPKLAVSKSVLTISPRLSAKHEKWWKRDLDSSGNSGHGSILSRRGWHQSKPVKSIKARKKRKKVMVQTAGTESHMDSKKNKNSLMESDGFLTATDVETDCYTTTDIEVVVSNNPGMKPSYTIESCESPTNSNQSQPADDFPKKSNISSLESREDVSKKQKTIDPVITSSTIKQPITKNDNVSDQQIDCLTDEIAENLAIQPLSPEPTMKETVVLNGISHDLYPSCDYRNTSNLDAPKEKLHLQWIYGFIGSHIFSVKSGEIVFFSGSVVVVMDGNEGRQRFYRKHSHKITSLCVHSDSITIASAQRKKDGEKCIVYIWNSVDLTTICSVFIESADVLHILAMDFQKKHGEEMLLGTIQQCNDLQKICIYKCQSSTLKYCVEMNDECVSLRKASSILFSSVDFDLFITFGQRHHVLFHQMNDETVNTEAGDFGDLSVAKTITSAIFNKDGNLITGDYNGNIYVWQNYKINHAIQNAHNGPITSLCFTLHGYLVSGCSKERVVLAWNHQMKCCAENFKLDGEAIGIETLCVSGKNLFIGTTENRVVKAVLTDVENPMNTSAENVSCILEGHVDTITSICCHPSYDEIMVLLSSDGLISMYNILSHCIMWNLQLKGNGSCSCLHPTEEFLLVGTQDGSIHLVNSTVGNFIGKFKNCSASVVCMKLSNDGNFLACGTVDGKIYFYQFDSINKELDLHCEPFQIFNSCVVDIDWSALNNVVRAQSKLKELKYYDAKNGRYVSIDSSTKWTSLSCYITYEMLGALKNNYLVHNDSFKFDCCHKKQLIAYTTSSNILGLVMLPWLHEETKSNTTPACGRGMVTKLCFSHDAFFLLTSFEETGTFYQWKVA